MKGFFEFCLLLVFVIFLVLFTSKCTGENVKKSVEDNEEISDDGKDDSLDIPADLDTPRNVTLCTRRKNSQMHEIRLASPHQFPFMAAIMSPRNEYVCSGSIISNGLILTTAQCTESISYVLINTTKDKKDENTISLHILKSENFPTYTGLSSLKNAAILYTEKHNNTIASKIKLSNRTFSRDFNDIEALGFGLNADVGHINELQYVGLDARDATENEIVGYIDCIETKVPTCFKDKGGPLIVDNELVGLITNGQDECTNEIVSTYAINKRMIKALPIYTIKAWLDDKILKHIEQGDEPLPTFPNKPILREPLVHKMTSAGVINMSLPIHLFTVIFLFIKRT